MAGIRVLALSGAACLLFSGPLAARATYTTFAAVTVAGINSSNTVTGSNGSEGFLRTVDGSVTTFAVSGAKATLPQSINDEVQWRVSMSPIIFMDLSAQLKET